MNNNEIKIKNWYTKKEIAHLANRSEKTIDRRKKELFGSKIDELKQTDADYCGKY